MFERTSQFVICKRHKDGKMKDVKTRNMSSPSEVILGTIETSCFPPIPKLLVNLDHLISVSSPTNYSKDMQKPKQITHMSYVLMVNFHEFPWISMNPLWKISKPWSQQTNPGCAGSRPSNLEGGSYPETTTYTWKPRKKTEVNRCFHMAVTESLHR